MTEEELKELAEELDYRLNEYIIKMMLLQAEVKRSIESGRLSAIDYEQDV